jgi:hypothetical protein
MKLIESQMESKMSVYGTHCIGERVKKALKFVQHAYKLHSIAIQKEIIPPPSAVAAAVVVRTDTIGNKGSQLYNIFSRNNE